MCVRGSVANRAKCEGEAIFTEGKTARNINTPETTKPLHFCRGFVLYGAGTRSRTRDLLITSQLLYQLSYTGVVGDDYSDWEDPVNP
jgi:hypothetical protein